MVDKAQSNPIPAKLRELLARKQEAIGKIHEARAVVYTQKSLISNLNSQLLREDNEGVLDAGGSARW